MNILSAQTYRAALSSLRNAPYGFCFVDLGITAQDIADFNSIDIREERFYQQFGELSYVEENVADFLSKIGNNERTVVKRVAARVAQITTQVTAASEKETAWIHLRASIPTDMYDIPRWHIDGYYYRPDPECMIYKFAVTLLGPSTLFYPLTKNLQEIAWKHMRDRKFMQEFCRANQVVTPNTGEGVFFIGGKNGEAALHSEPPIHENRLFFSIVPCSEKQLSELKIRILALYPKQSSKVYSQTSSP